MADKQRSVRPHRAHGARDRWWLRPRPGTGPRARRARCDRDRAGPQRGRACARRSRRLGAPHRYIVGDLTTDALYEELDEIPEHVDIVVNNAGGDPHSKPWGQQTTQEWRDTYEINVIAAERLCALFIPKMAARGGGASSTSRRSTARSGRTPTTRAERRCRRVHRGQARPHRPDELPRVPDRSHRRDHQHAEPGHDHLDGDARRRTGALEAIWPTRRRWAGTASPRTT